jgi:hypothetical protein
MKNTEIHLARPTLEQSVKILTEKVIFFSFFKKLKKRSFFSITFILVVQMFKESGLSCCAAASETSLQV